MYLCLFTSETIRIPFTCSTVETAARKAIMQYEIGLRLHGVQTPPASRTLPSPTSANTRTIIEMLHLQDDLKNLVEH